MEKIKKYFFEKVFRGDLKKFFWLKAHICSLFWDLFWPKIPTKNHFWRFSRPRGESLVQEAFGSVLERPRVPISIFCGWVGDQRASRAVAEPSVPDYFWDLFWPQISPKTRFDDFHDQGVKVRVQKLFACVFWVAPSPAFNFFGWVGDQEVPGALTWLQRGEADKTQKHTW